mgnify:CR=1 FL=1
MKKVLPFIVVFLTILCPFILVKYHLPDYYIYTPGINSFYFVSHAQDVSTPGTDKSYKIINLPYKMTDKANIINLPVEPGNKLQYTPL